MLRLSMRSPKFLYISSPSVAHAGAALVGAGNGDASPEHARGNYARSKAVAEKAVLQMNGTALSTGEHLCTGALRPHLIWGPGDTQLVERILERARAGRLPLLSGGTGLIDTLYIDNAADAVVHGYERLEALAGRAVVVTNGQPRTVAELMSGFCTAVGVPAPRFSVPAPVAVVAGRLIEKVWVLLPHSATAGDEPPMTGFLAEQLSTAHWFDQRNTRELLGWERPYQLKKDMSGYACFMGISTLGRKGSLPPVKPRGVRWQWGHRYEERFINGSRTIMLVRPSSRQRRHGSPARP